MCREGSSPAEPRDHQTICKCTTKRKWSFLSTTECWGHLLRGRADWVILLSAVVKRTLPVSFRRPHIPSPPHSTLPLSHTLLSSLGSREATAEEPMVLGILHITASHPGAVTSAWPSLWSGRTFLSLCPVLPQNFWLNSIFPTICAPPAAARWKVLCLQESAAISVVPSLWKCLTLTFLTYLEKKNRKKWGKAGLSSISETMSPLPSSLLPAPHSRMAKQKSVLW